MDLEYALQREWLETNGIGGYASSTLAGLNTRRYHGLLVAATRPPVGRMVLLSKFDETLVVGGRRHELSANLYPGVVHPQGHRYLAEFRRAPHPVFVYEVQGCRLEKSVRMVQGRNATTIEYSLSGQVAEACRLELRPLIAFRDYHSTTHENGRLNPHVEIGEGWLKLEPYPGVPAMYLVHARAEVRVEGSWYRNFEFDRERERGLDYREDLFNPCVMVFDIGSAGSASVMAATEREPAAESVPAAANDGDAFTRMLTRAADQFIVRRGQQHTVIAGYHWFSDWGRDTMISLPGLTLTTGRADVARSILKEFAEHVDQGMLPNRFPDAGEKPEYNTVDATLWYFEAARALMAHTGDVEFVRRDLYPVLDDIISWHERGTRYGIRVDNDGLLMAGAPGVQLTWMDAKIGDWVVTPRRGKPVEIQALWYNALRTMQQLAPRNSRYAQMADRAHSSFLELFWNEEAGCLYDVVEGEKRDASIRPNQVFALSLFHKLLPPEKAKSVLDVVEKHLLTPYGLRSLSPADPAYRGRYEGDPRSRDSAYHQGTVWPWLLGPFVSAYLGVHGRTPQALEQVRGWTAELRRFMDDAGVGQIPEVFDGDAPHRAGGCIAQAWSVAELLRVWMEETGVEIPVTP
jgi:predicted glycogen debranching enzyme